MKRLCLDWIVGFTVSSLLRRRVLDGRQLVCARSDTKKTKNSGKVYVGVVMPRNRWNALVCIHILSYPINSDCYIHTLHDNADKQVEDQKTKSIHQLEHFMLVQ